MFDYSDSPIHTYEGGPYLLSSFFRISRSTVFIKIGAAIGETIDITRRSLSDFTAETRRGIDGTTNGGQQAADQAGKVAVNAWKEIDNYFQIFSP